MFAGRHLPVFKCIVFNAIATQFCDSRYAVVNNAPDGKQSLVNCTFQIQKLYGLYTSI